MNLHLTEVLMVLKSFKGAIWHGKNSFQTETMVVFMSMYGMNLTEHVSN